MMKEQYIWQERVAWSREVKVITWIVVGMYAASLLYIFLVINSLILRGFTTLFILIPLFLLFNFSLTEVAITDEVLLIRRRGSKVKIPRTQILEVLPLVASIPLSARGIFSSRGIFGYMGRCYHNKVGHFSMCATNRATLVLIKTERKQYLISVNDRVAFIEQLGF